MLCRVLKVSASGYYSWLTRGPCARSAEDDRLRALVKEIHAASRGSYGAPRIRSELEKREIRISQRRVARLMREARIAGVSRRRGVPTTRSDGSQSQPDKVERDFTASAPNRLWVADITYVPTLSGFLFLAMILDVYSRRIFGWSMRRDLTANLAVEALDMAGESRSVLADPPFGSRQSVHV
jgi:putative transposase